MWRPKNSRGMKMVALANQISNEKNLRDHQHRDHNRPDILATSSPILGPQPPHTKWNLEGPMPIDNGEIWPPYDYEYDSFLPLMNDSDFRLLKRHFGAVCSNDEDNYYFQIEEALNCSDDTDKDPDFGLDDCSSQSSSDYSCFDLETHGPRKTRPQVPKVKRQSPQSNSEDQSTLGVQNHSQAEPIFTPSSNNDVEKKSRKKKARPSEWKANKSKMLRNSGKEYYSLKAKKCMPPRKVKPACMDCTKNCTSKFTEEERENIFSSYWKMGDLGKQREFIVRHSTEIKPQYRYPSKKNRNLNRAFFFQKNSQQLRVCKKFFMATLDINRRTIATSFEKNREGFIADDFRGKHDKRNHVDQNIKTSMRAHINSIPRIESHYLRQQSKREYIEGGKSIAQIYRDYVNDCNENHLPYGTLSTFTKIFNFEFNIAFYVPKKDQCEFCVAYENSEDVVKQQTAEQYNRHQEEKRKSREEKEKDKKNEDPNVIVCTYDLQAALPTPKGEVSVFYYKSKLSTFNLTIYELKSKQGYCNVWHEGDGKKGAIEIATCVLKYIDGKMSEWKSTDGKDGLEFIFYSDNCVGQQKNKYVIIMYMYAIRKYYPKIKSITHKFLIKGHTQNEGDGMHSIIEKECRRACKSGPIYTPQQYVQLMRSAKKTNPVYKVKEYIHSDFINFKSLSNKLGNNFNTNTKFENVNFADIKMIQIGSEEPFHFKYKTSYNDEFSTVNIFQNKKRKRKNPEEEKITIKKRKCKNRPDEMEENKKLFDGWKEVPAYDTPPGIPKNKKEGLMSLINGNHIPRAYFEFYNSLVVNSSN